MQFRVKNALLFVLGAAIGFGIADLTSGEGVNGAGVLPPLAFSMGALSIHIHHWIWASIGMVTLYAAQRKKQFGKPVFIYAALGLLLGIALQGIIDYSDWHHIISWAAK